MNLHPTETVVLSTIREHKMINSGERVIVAVSGGPDSVCLLEILFQLREILNICLIVAHLDHGLRPGEDESETEFVEKLASRLGLAFTHERAAQLANAHGSSLEETAREIRYKFFERSLKEHHAQRVALGHNKNDQAETVLMNILRGTGSSGLSGMPPVRDNLFIRPLIKTTRDELLAYLREKDLSYMTDSSNLEKKHLRNRMRLELIPSLLTYQPRLIEHLNDLAFLCREENRFMEQEARKCLQDMVSNSSEGTFDLPLAVVTGLPSPLKYRVIREAIKRAKGNLRRVHFRHIRAITDLVENRKPQAGINLPDHVVVKKIYDRLRFSRAEEPEAVDFSYAITGAGIIPIREINMSIACEEVPRQRFTGRSQSDRECFLDLEALRWPLKVRNFRAGDKFMPLGLNGFKKLKDLFIEQRIPSGDRKRIPILESNGDIAWVCGIRIDHRYRVRGNTRRILRCNIE
ncbi:MAG: tRNA lysidine(34) synthetase TilS [Deltaproteobacteria bacterium]|nr:tRNA lysidine(34) synthetase TilS [Deltaproteobacteria bacterium]MBW2077572.1 tRNA lysidine(34) synthetase TilS [Deltaproteobacteria bacterium]MBW2309914.1 tRNA lysidine(34) synthetase TilS [Deltaproteobacteria bacterium]